jgi:peptidylprolyl isomerase
MPPMKKGFLIIAALLALLLAGCGGDDSSTDTSGSDTTAAEPFRIPVGTPPIRRAEDLKFKANGLVGSELKPIIPDSPPPKELAVSDLVQGIGESAIPGRTVTVQYAGYLYDNGKKFDSSWDQGKPFTFKLGAGQVIPGWEEGIVGMEISDRRELVIPPDMGYGEQQVGSIPPNSTLVFVVELLDVKTK